ncbi:MAG: hypothetical protein O3A53_12855 [Acidobacteria bacterium]|nr:hypothetical protein [Acidobacteriota bacterium]MDA1235680.1 hypothetical protein [Acidobacteriota bacterium]
MTNCRQTQLEMIGPALSLEALQHLENCAACRARLRAEQSLGAALGETPSYDAPGASLSPQLAAALQPHRSASRWLLLAAALILIAGPSLWFALRKPDVPPPAPAPDERIVRYTPFLVLDPLSPDLAAGRGRLVRATLPSSAPAAYGLFLPDTQGSVEADVLLGDDGAIYAVRFVY